MALKNTKMKFRKIARCMVAAGMILAAGMTDVKVDSADTPSSIEAAKETVDVAPETEAVSVYYYTPEESVFHPEASTVEAATTEATTENVSSTSPDNPECPECDGYYLNESKGKAVAAEEVSDTEAFKLTVSNLPDESPAVSDDRNNNLRYGRGNYTGSNYGSSYGNSDRSYHRRFHFNSGRGNPWRNRTGYQPCN